MRVRRYVLATAGLVVTLLLQGAAGGPLHGLRQDDEAARQRPFEHRRHERLSCRACHGTGERHRTIRVRSARDCAACHHATPESARCAGCHDAAALPEGVSVSATPQPPTLDANARVLTFGHGRHAGVACTECHRTDVVLRRDRDCASCHDRHHVAAAECSSCHDGAVRALHQAKAHISCAGAGCHAPARLPAIDASRTLCLVCHDEQRAHEPDGDCAACHRIRELRPAGVP